MSAEQNEEELFANRSRASDLERIKQARKKRITQLKNWYQYDKIMEKQKIRVGKPQKSNFLVKRVHFPQSMVLLEAAGREDIDEVKRLLTEGASPDVCNEDGLTALHQCCIDNSLSICQLLLQFGANVNAADSEMWTPLHAAAACAHIEICACLIDYGANLLALNAEGNMPYDICEEENTLDLIENAMAARGISQDEIDEKRKEPELEMLRDLQELKLRNGNLAKIDSQGASYLHIAASCGYLEVGRFLIEHGVPIDILDKEGWQPIHIAACWGQLEFIEKLISHGVNIDAVTYSGETVYDLCEDPEINRKLHQIKQELERNYELKKSLQVRPNLSVLGRRSNSSKRSASIRRSSMREKSLMSRNEARKEAMIREVVEKKISEPKYESSIDTKNSGSNTNEINLDQVMLDVQAFSQKEPFVRRGSSRNSFTHSHPYHSPSRDLSLSGECVSEETAVDDCTENTVPLIQTAIRNSHRKITPPKSENFPMGNMTANKANQSYPDSPFVRGLDSNRSGTNNSKRHEKPRHEIENVPLAKPQKTQGCCILM